MDLDEAKKILTDAGMFLTEQAGLKLDTAEIDTAIEKLQKHRDRLVPIGEEVAKFLPEQGIKPTQFGIGQNESGRFVLWIGMPRNKWYSIAAYDDGLQINADGDYTITTTKEEYLPKLLNALKGKKR